jgi:hypothetical protein
METINNMTKDDLKKIIKESMSETFSEDKIKEIFFDVIEDIAMEKAIDDGLKSENIDKKDFMSKLKFKIQG